MCRTLRNGGFEIAAHPNRQTAQAVAFRDLCQQRKVERGFFFDRRNAHQPGNRKIEPPAFGDESVRVTRHDTCFLLFFAGVDLNE